MQFKSDNTLNFTTLVSQNWKYSEKLSALECIEKEQKQSRKHSATIFEIFYAKRKFQNVEMQTAPYGLIGSSFVLGLQYYVSTRFFGRIAKILYALIRIFFMTLECVR